MAVPDPRSQLAGEPDAPSLRIERRQRASLRRRAEDPLVVASEGRPPSVLEEPAGDPRPEGDRPLAGFRPRRVLTATHPRLADAQVVTVGIGEVDLPPPEFEDLAAPEPSLDEDE